jgi:hypothetical protein
MKTFTPSHPMPYLRSTTKFLLTFCMLVCITAGWFLGRFHTHTSTTYIENNTDAQYRTGNVLLPSVHVNGEALPTVVLSECLITSPSK